MYEYTLIRTEVEKPPPFVNGSMTRDELTLAKKVLRTVGNSNFSVVAFGECLFEAAMTHEETEKMFLASLYHIARVAGFDDRPVGIMARRIMDSLEGYGHLEGVDHEDFV